MILAECQKCNAPIFSDDLVERLGHLTTYRSSYCGHEISMTVSFSLPPGPPVKYRTVVARFTSSKPTATELRALRSLHPESANKSINDLRLMLATGLEIELGSFIEGKALELQAAAKEMGLELFFRD